MAVYYPVFIDVKRRQCVVIGGGAIGEEKVRRLLDCEADVAVISPEVAEGVRLLSEEGLISWTQRQYRAGDLSDVFIAIAATDDNEVNRQIAAEAESRNVLLNVVDVTHLCTFIAPSVVRRGDVTVAVSTGGASPALARKFREELTTNPLMEYADLAPILSEARTELKRMGAVVPPDRWQAGITEELLDLVQAGRTDEARQTLMSGLLSGSAPVPAGG